MRRLSRVFHARHALPHLRSHIQPQEQQASKSTIAGQETDNVWYGHVWFQTAMRAHKQSIRSSVWQPAGKVRQVIALLKELIA